MKKQRIKTKYFTFDKTFFKSLVYKKNIYSILNNAKT